MSAKFKQIAREQNSRIVDEAVALLRLPQPGQGWIRTLRSALTMSGAALSKRLGGHRSTASYLERSELDGSVTLKKLQQTAEAMDCRFVYAMVPRAGEDVRTLIERQAENVARRIVEQGSVQMMLEGQQLSEENKEKEVQRLKDELQAKMPRDFWDD